MTHFDLRTSLFKHPQSTWLIIPLRSGIWLTPIQQPRMLAMRGACNSYSLGHAFHFLELDLGALAKPASVGILWPLDHGLGAAEQPANGLRTTPRAWNLHAKLHLAAFNWKQKAYSPVSSLGCPRGVRYLGTISVFISPQNESELYLQKGNGDTLSTMQNKPNRGQLFSRICFIMYWLSELQHFLSLSPVCLGRF